MPSPENNFYVSFSQNNWDLHRQGSVDEARHREKVWEAIGNNLPEIISGENIITSDGQGIVKVPIRQLEDPHFRFDQTRQPRTGSGNGNSKVGDIVAPGPEQSKGQGKQAGNQPGEDFIEVEVKIDDLVDLIFQDLSLPKLKPKSNDYIETTQDRFTDIGKVGPISRLDKIRTVRKNISRRAKAGKPPKFGQVTKEDLRFRTSNPTIRQESNAAIIAMRDVSGSMGEFEKYISRSFYFWMVRFLRTKYQNVKIVFITHHTEAKEVDEETFFKLGESGGTRVSSAYELALQTINERFNPNRWNIYPFHFSDGDNYSDEDNKKCVKLVLELLKVCNIFGYGEIRQSNTVSYSVLMAAFEKAFKSNDQCFIDVVIRSKQDVYPALKRFFSDKSVEGAVSRA